MKKQFVAVLSLVLLCSSSMKGGDQKEPEFSVRVDCSSEDVVLEPKKAPENGFFKHINWGNKEYRKFALTGETRISMKPKWEKFIFAFIPKSDGVVRLYLMSNYSSFKKSGDRESYNAHWIYFDDVTISGVDGFVNGGFEQLNGLPVGWTCLGGKHNLPASDIKPHAGKFMTKAWHNQQVSVKLTVKNNVPVTVTFYAMKAYFELGH